MTDDINIILGSALEARGLSPEQSSSLIKTIETLLRQSNYYMTHDEHEAAVRELIEQIGYHLQTIEAYRARERQCAVGGCVDNQTTEKVVLPELEAEIYLCNVHQRKEG